MSSTVPTIPRPKIFGMDQQLGLETEETYRDMAAYKYPSLPADEALLLYVQKNQSKDIFFPHATTGERCIYREDIDHELGKTYRKIRVRMEEGSDDCNRTYYLLPRWYKLKAIDARRLPRQNILLIKHTSEHEWNRQVDDEHHFLKFPEEVQLMIMGFVLTDSESLSPEVVPSNWKRQWQLPSLSNTLSYTLPITREDQAGAYTELRSVTRPVIDACLLRVSKHFQDLGTTLLYTNVYSFHTKVPTLNRSPPLMIYGRGNKRHVHRPRPRQPSSQDHVEIAAGISDIQKKTPLVQVRGWLYYDPLLRFIYNIGMAKAAMITSLELSGPVLRHECMHNCECIHLGENFIPALEIYVSFIFKFLPSLHTLTLHTSRDYQNENQAEYDSDGKVIDPHVNELKDFIRNHLVKVKSLVTLKVLIDGDEHSDFADDIEWFVERERQRLKKNREEQESMK